MAASGAAPPQQWVICHLYNLLIKASVDKRNIMRKSHAVFVCDHGRQKDKEHKGVCVVSSPVSRHAGSQPDSQTAWSHRFSYGSQTNTFNPFFTTWNRIWGDKPRIQSRSLNYRKVTAHCCMSICGNTGCVLNKTITGFPIERSTQGREAISQT